MQAVIADDDRTTTTILARALTRWGVEVTVANDGLTAWGLLESASPSSLAIVDWMMPGLDGIEICKRIRAAPALAGMYVILLTARGSRADLIAGLDAGADDYMVKPIDTEELRARMHVGMRVVELQDRLAARVMELQVARDELSQLVSTDVLTELNSRRRWFELAKSEFDRHRRYKRPLGVMVLDIDFFKQVNDNFGHAAGDELLRHVGAMLRMQSRQSDIPGRIGGEEFVVALPETSAEASQEMAYRVIGACRSMVVPTPAGNVTCTCSIGISQATAADESIEDVLRRADAALYEAKRSGRDRWKSDTDLAAT